MHVFGHLRTVCRHRRAVRRHCFAIGLYRQGLTHDLSKFSPTEFLRGAKYWQGNYSPNDRERHLMGYSLAWMHHKGRNRHHFEFWTDLDPKTGRYEAQKMPLKYLAEMLCDRMAASKTYLGADYTDRAPLDYFTSHRAKALMHPENADLLLSWLTLLANEGEDAVFSEVRRALREEKVALREEKRLKKQAEKSKK